ncbi:MAG TPA: ankyrin repeat domain-containing protein [Pyrinomonadaceae bacterium]|nr:ankyrin repeat domain-containing protein [Pyrinomonadaceae bacterium]
MPASFRSFDRMSIPAPCDAEWDAMTGNDQVRFCEHCNLHVNDLSSLTRAKALQLVEQSQGRLCVRFIQKPNGGMLSRKMPEKLYRIRRRVSRLAASAFTATISISTAMAQNQTSTGLEERNAAVELIRTEHESQPLIDEFRSSVMGVIKTHEGIAISSATVFLVDRETGEERSVVSSGLGEYSFHFLPHGDYLLWARKTGFRTEIQTGTVTGTEPLTLDLQMTERGIVFSIMGAMAAFMESEDPLFKAIQENDVQKVQALASTDIYLNQPNRRYGMSTLTAAVQRGNREIVAALLTYGAAINLRDGGGRTALMYVSNNTTPELLRDLISIGARLNSRDDSGASPLMIAASSATAKVLRDLIEAGAQVDARDSEGETCLFNAARNNTKEALTVLLDAGVDLNVRNEDGNTALMVIASSGKFESFQMLLDRGADRDLNEDGQTLLMLAVLNEDPRLARLLLERGAEVNTKDKFGNTALMSAAEAGRIETVRLLAAANADLDQRNSYGETALIKAVSGSSLECVQALLDAGAGFKSKNKEGQTALALARERNYAEIVTLLKSRGAPE